MFGLPGIIALGFALAVVQIFLVDIPPVLDYPNHLARFWLLSGGDKIAAISKFYEVDWGQASTNIGVDAIAALMGKVVPYTIAGKIVLAASVVGPTAAAAWLNRVLFDRWHWWQLSFVVLSWTTTALAGFMSYQISLALALGIASFDNSLPVNIFAKNILRVLFAFIILMFHPFGLLFYGMLLASFVIGEQWSGIFQRDHLIVVARGLILPIFVVLIPAVYLLLLAPAPPGNYVGTGQFPGVLGLIHLHGAALTLESPFLTYNSWIDAAFVTPLLAILVYSVVTGRARTHAGMIIVGLAVAGLALVAPHRIGDESNIDRRLPLMAVLLLFTGVLPNPFSARLGRLACGASVFALGAARAIWIGVVWHSRQQDVQSIEHALAHMPAGSSLFTVMSKPEDIRTQPVGRYLIGMPGGGQGGVNVFHVPALAVPQRSAFIGTFFATRGQQPVKVLPPWNTMLMDLNNATPDLHMLNLGAEALQATHDPYVEGWGRFDYVIALGMDSNDPRGSFEPPNNLQLVSDDGFARLYRVVR